MAISRVQFATGSFDQTSGSPGDPTVLQATWSGATGSGSDTALMALIGKSLVSGGTTFFTPDSGAWGSAVNIVDNATNVGIDAFVITSPSSRSGTETFRIVGDRRDSVIVLVEYASDTMALVLDAIGADNTGTSTNPNSGALAPTVNASIARIAMMANRNTNAQSSPTNSFSEFAEVQSPHPTTGNRVNFAVHDRIHTSSASLSCQTTISTSRPWAGLQLILREVSTAQSVNLGLTSSATSAQSHGRLKSAHLGLAR